MISIFNFNSNFFRITYLAEWTALHYYNIAAGRLLTRKASLIYLCL